MLDHGYIQIYTGDGKGKTTASLGLALRALGHGWKVLIIQFTKGKQDDDYYGEIATSKLLPNLKVVQFGMDRVVYSHIKTGQDFYKYEPEEWDLIVSNPPFTGKADIFRRALSFDKPFALLMTITWLNDAAPANVFKDRELQILSFNERMQFKNRVDNKINFLSAYFCYKFLPKNFIFRSFRNKGQMRLNLQ